MHNFIHSKPTVLAIGGTDVSCFDTCYVERLRIGASDTAEHFASYFVGLLNAILRKRLRCPYLIDDVRQETIARVLIAVRSGKLQYPGRLASYVTGVCHRVLLEHLREQRRHGNSQSDCTELVEHRQGPHEEALNLERRGWVMRILDQLPERDREVLRLVYLDGASRSDVCRRLDVRRSCLRLVLHRAKLRFRRAADNAQSLGTHDAHGEADRQPQGSRSTRPVADAGSVYSSIDSTATTRSPAR